VLFGPHLKKFGLENVPGIVSEDATVALRRLDSELVERLIEQTPWFPFAMVATDNRFDHAWVFDRWRVIHKGCEMYSLPLAGHISDGDARLAWRMRVQLLSPKKEWEIGPGLRVGVAHLDSLRSWLGDREPGRDPLESVEEAAMVLAFVMHWRHHVVNTRGLTLEANFLTRETFLDIVTSCVLPRHSTLD